MCVGVCVWNESLFFRSLARKSDLGISGFGISVTTMEEVFIKVGEGTDESLERRYIHTVHTVHNIQYIHTYIHTVHTVYTYSTYIHIYSIYIHTYIHTYSIYIHTLYIHYPLNICYIVHNIVHHVLYRVERTGTLTDIPLASPTSPKAPSGVHSHTHTHTTAFVVVFVYFVGYCLLLLSCATSICNVCVWLSLATEDGTEVEVRGEGGNGTLKPLAPPRDFGEHTHTHTHTHTIFSTSAHAHFSSML